MADSLTPDFFSSCLDIQLPSVTQIDLFAQFDPSQFDPSTFIAPFDPPTDSTGSSGSDNDSSSPLPFPSTPVPPFVSPVPLKAEPDSPNGLKRKAPATSPVTLPAPVVKELLKSQEEKKSRLARKAELARQSRRKKKMRMCDLEKEVTTLQVQLTQAREEIKKLTKNNTITNLGKTNSAPALTFDQLVTELVTGKGKPNSLVTDLLLTLKKDNTSLETFLQTLNQSLAPPMAVQFLEWTLTRGEHFYNESTQFGHLFHETMKSSSEQIQSLLSLRKQVQTEIKLKDQKVIDAITSLQSALQTRIKQTETFEKLRTIFTPQQLVQYLNYAKQFGHVLIKVPM